MRAQNPAVRLRVSLALVEGKAPGCDPLSIAACCFRVTITHHPVHLHAVSAKPAGNTHQSFVRILIGHVLVNHKQRTASSGDGPRQDEHFVARKRSTQGANRQRLWANDKHASLDSGLVHGDHANHLLAEHAGIVAPEPAAVIREHADRLSEYSTVTAAEDSDEPSI